jgi:hypothetical protein
MGSRESLLIDLDQAADPISAKYDFGYAYGAKPGFALEWRMKISLVEPTSSIARKQLSSAEVFHAAVWADERLDGSVDGGHVGSLARMHQKIVPGFMRPHTNRRSIKNLAGPGADRMGSFTSQHPQRIDP